jgi:hypothetical protein
MISIMSKEAKQKVDSSKTTQQKKDEARLQEAKFAKDNPDKILIYDVKTRTMVPVLKKDCTLKTVHTNRGTRKQIVGLYRPDSGEPRQVYRFVSADFKLEK